MLILLLIIIGLTALALTGRAFGRDSRPFFDERREGERFGALR